MDKLWAPWRVKYITTAPVKKSGCVFCGMLKQNKDRENFIFIRSRYCFAVLNLFPYNNGHSLVLPYRHVNDLAKLRPDELTDLFALLMRTKKLLSLVLSPEGYNIGMNLGKVSGAGIPGHIHFHVVPRWKGDVNFMPVTADTKVISQSLTELYEHLWRREQEKQGTDFS